MWFFTLLTEIMDRRFIILSARDNRIINRYVHNKKWIKVDVLPYYRDIYVCFASNSNFSFDDLFTQFLYGNEDETIGAMSVIAEKYPLNLLSALSEQKGIINRDKLCFLLEKVIPDYLPLIIPRNMVKDYQFGDNDINDVWVKILESVKWNCNG